MGKRELVALLTLSSWCLMMVEWLFLAVLWGCLRFVIVVFRDHTHLLFFIKKEHEVAVFFDLEKAYDTTWRYGILKDIHKLGLRGRLPTFIKHFLADRIIQVRVDSSLSDYYDQEQCVPQGGVLSTTLFNIKINDIVKCLGNLTDCSLYVDDFCICFAQKAWRRLNANCNKN